MEDLKILVGYDKKIEILKSDIFVPIQLGRALLLNNDIYIDMIGDDSNENISKYYKEFGSLTSIFWAWKNYNILGNPKFIGFYQENRHFICNNKYTWDNDCPDKNIFFKLDKNYFNETSVYDIANLIKKENIDFVVPPFYPVKKVLGSNFKSIDDFNKSKEYYNSILGIIKKLYPEYLDTLNKYINSEFVFYKNIFITKKNIFFEMCQFLFSILFEYYDYLKYDNLFIQYEKEIIYISEIIMGLFFYKRMNENKEKYKILPLSFIKNSPSCKLFVVYHKPDKFIKNSVITPINAGRAILQDNKESKDGILSENDIIWMKNNMIGDNTGDNISKKNRYYAEATVLYWMWKNIDSIGTDYLGLMHYRRVFVFDSQIDGARIFLDSFDDVHKYLNLDSIASVVSESDIICPRMLHQNRSEYDSYRDLHDINDLNFVLDYIKLKYPTMYSSALEYLLQNNAIYWNLLIMKKDIFIDYCKFLFDCLFAVENNVSIEGKDKYNQRYLGFLSERLTAIYLWDKLKEKKFRITMLPTAYIQNTCLYNYVLPVFNSNKTIPIFMSSDKNYLKYCYVLVKSIVDNSDKNYNYDIIILESNIDKFEQLTFIREFNKKNISIRFFNMNIFISNIKFNLCAHFTKETYFRLYAADIFKNYSKIIYLDIDTIVLDSLVDLYNSDISDYALAACLDYGVLAKLVSKKYESLSYFKETLGIDDPFSSYFQAGVLLFNLEFFRKNSLQEKLINEIHNEYKYVDQDVLNKVLYRKVLFLDGVWNVNTNEGRKKGLLEFLPYTLYKNYMKSRENPKIVHFSSNIKPWNMVNSDLSYLWWSYARNCIVYESILFSSIKNSLLQSSPKDNKLNTGFISKEVGEAEKIVKSHLSWIIGDTILKNISTVKGVIMLPLNLYRTVCDYKKIKKTPHKPLTSYKDYDKAVKIINSFRYQLGKIFIDANKSKFKLGVLFIPVNILLLFLRKR